MAMRGEPTASEAHTAARSEEERKLNLSEKQRQQEKNADNPPTAENVEDKASEEKAVSFKNKPSPDSNKVGVSDLGNVYVPGEPGEASFSVPQEKKPATLGEREVILTGEALFHRIESIKDHRRAIQEHLDGLVDNEETKQERQFLQQEIDRVNEELNPLLNQAASEILDKLRRGEKMNNQERTYLVEDLVNSMDKSALAELVVSREGFKNFQELLNKLGVKSVRVEDHVVHLENDREASFLKKLWGKSWVKEHTKKLASTAVISAAAVGAIGLLGGPVTWAAMLGGLAGGTVARLGVERWRYSRLNKDGLGDKVAEDFLRHIYDLQRHGREALEADNEQVRAEKIAKILSGIDLGEKESLKNYRQLQRKAGKLNLVWGIVGSVAGAGLGAMALRGAEFSQLMDKAANEGVRLDLDGDGYAHLVKQNADGAWRFMLEQNDPQRLQEMLAGEHGAEFAQEHWRHYWENYLTVVGREGVPGGVAFAPSPEQLAEIQGPTNLFHIGNPEDPMGEGFRAVIEEMFNRQLTVKTAAVVSAMGGAHALVEGGFNLKEGFRLAPERLRRHDRPLIHELEAEAIRLKKLSPSAETSALAPEAAVEKEGPAKPEAENLGFAVGDIVKVRRSSGEEESGWRIHEFFEDEDGVAGALVVSPDEKHKKKIALEKLIELNPRRQPEQVREERKVPIKVTESAEKLMPRYEAYLAGKLDQEEAAKFAKKEIDKESVKAFRQIYTKLLEKYKQLPPETRRDLSFLGVINKDRVGFNRISFGHKDGRREFIIGYKWGKEGKIDQEIIIRTGGKRHKPNQMEALKFLRQVYQRLESRSDSPAEEGTEKKRGKEKVPEESHHHEPTKNDGLGYESPAKGTVTVDSDRPRKTRREKDAGEEKTQSRRRDRRTRDARADSDETESEGSDDLTGRERRHSGEGSKKAEPTGRLTDSLSRFLEKRGIGKIEELKGVSALLDLTKDSGATGQLRKIFPEAAGAETIELKITNTSPMIDSEGNTYNFMVTLSDSVEGGREVKIQLTDLYRLIG